MKFSVAVFFHLRSADAYMDAKRAALKAIDMVSEAVMLEGVDDRLDGALAPLEPDVKEVMVGFQVEAPSLNQAETVAGELYSLMRSLLKFIELPEQDRITVEQTD